MVALSAGGPGAGGRLTGAPRLGAVSERRIDPAHWEAAVADSDGPQLVVAGPGTGKTEFLARRSAHLIEAGRAAPEELCILAFSRRGAHELRRRVEARLDRSYTAIAASTFHSFCLRLLETYRAGDELPSLLTGPEQVELVRELLRREAPQAWPVAFRELLSTQTFAEEVTDFLLRAHEQLLDPEGLAERAAGRDDWRALPAFAATYRQELAARRRIDYGTLQVEAVRLLGDPEVGREVGTRYRYLLVDEYQDTTRAQAALLERLYRIHRNLTAAADPYQSVYSFRGAELSNVAEFPARFPDAEGRPARRLVLTTSFRVPEAILRAAERVTAGGELPGAAGPVRPAPHQGRVDTYLFDQHSHEAEWIAAEVQRLHFEERIPYRGMAVLVRTRRRILPELSRALERRRVPHDPPDARLADRPAVRLVLDCVAAATGDPDAPETDLVVRRLLLGPLFGLPIGKERDLRRARLREGRSWADMFRREVPEGGTFAELLDDPSWSTGLPATGGFWHLWTRLPQFGRLVADPERAAWRAAWSSLAQALGRQAERDRHVSLLDYLRRTEQEEFEAQPLLSFRDQEGDRLTLTTLHQGKGLEFEVVFIADAVEGVFPDLRPRSSLLEPRLLSPSQTLDPAAVARFRVQEELRLAYTAMTRARRRVVWTATTAGLDEGEGGVSRFLPLVAGVDSLDELDTRPAQDGRPVTPLEAEGLLRRIVTEPDESPARRLAAMAALGGGAAHGLRSPQGFAGLRSRGGDVGLVPSDLVLSPSQAEAYKACPRRYALERRLRVDAGSGLYAELGGMIHRVLEEAERAALERGEGRSTVEEALELLGGLWSAGLFGGGAWAEAWWRRAERIVRRLYELWPSPAHPVALEHHLSLTMGDVSWQGRADRIEAENGAVRVVDYKTGKTPASRAEAGASPQLGFYLLAAARDPEICRHGTPTEAEFWYPAHEARRLTVRPFDPDNLPAVEEELGGIARGIFAEDWAPRVGPVCQRCPVRGVCPAWPEGREAYLR